MISLSTNGRGWWSDKSKLIKITKIELHGLELRVFFKKKEWNVDRDGLIYTDPEFQRGLRKYLKRRGLKTFSQVCYSEQGMQGDNYVSFDVSNAFVKEIFGRALR